VHACGSRLVRRRGDDLTAARRVAIAADDDRLAGQLGSASDLHRGEELVEIDVQHHRCGVAIVRDHALDATPRPWSAQRTAASANSRGVACYR